MFPGIPQPGGSQYHYFGTLLFVIYQIIFYLSTAGGQILIRGADPAGFIPFTLATILVVLALTPLSMTRRESPGISQGERLSLRKLYSKSPTVRP